MLNGLLFYRNIRLFFGFIYGILIWNINSIYLKLWKKHCPAHSLGICDNLAKLLQQVLEKKKKMQEEYIPQNGDWKGNELGYNIYTW